ncbi:MAG: AI-2E family transporter [Calditrichaeota bacterium]|nr:MAG: AI-2E family transporter [Calditrichota bacterium]
MSYNTREIMIRDTRIIIGLLSILSVIAIGMVLYQARAIVLPFALALFISYILNPLISFFEKRRVPVFVSIFIAVIITFLLLGLLGVLINTSIQSFAAEFPKYEKRLDMIYNKTLELINIPPNVFSGDMEANDRTQLFEALDKLSITGIITQLFRSITRFLSNTVLVLLCLVFILMGRNQLIAKLDRAFKPRLAERLTDICTNINIQIQKYILAKTLISLITALLSTVVLFLFGVEFALIWGILTFLLNFIPNIGSFIATILPLSIAFIQFENSINVLWVALCLIGIQFIMGNLFDPRFVGRSINLSPLVVLFSLIFWGWLLGMVGMFLAVPLTVVIKIIFENIESLRFLSVLMSAPVEH